MNDNMNGSVLAMSAPELPASLKAVIGRAESAVAEQQRIEQAMETARGGLRQAELELADAQERLAVAESGEAVGAGDVDKNARKRLVAARDEVDFARARVAGIEDWLRVPAHSSHGSWTRNASASAHASASVNLRCLAMASNSGTSSVRPVGSKRSSGGRRGLYVYSAFGTSGTCPSAAILAGGLFLRVASGTCSRSPCRGCCRPQQPSPSSCSP